MVAPAYLIQALTGELTAPPVPTPEITGFEVREGAPAWGFEVLDCNTESELPNIKSFIDRTSALALVAAKIALADAALARESRPAGVEIGCAYGSALGCLEAMGIFWNKVKTSNPKFAQPLAFTQSYANSPSSLLCIEYGLHGAAATFSGERLAALEGVLFAFDQIASGSAEIVLAGGSESLSPAAHRHLQASGQLSRSGQWDDGIVPGEGAVMLILESEESAKRRKAKIYAEIEGINFFPLDPKSTVAPIQLATDPRETLVFMSTPNINPDGGWGSPLMAAELSVATKFYTGDMLSVSPVLGIALSAGVLQGRYQLAMAGKKGLPLLHPAKEALKVRYAMATGYEPNGWLGVAMLKQCS